jgi:hypothetical protein
MPLLVLLFLVIVLFAGKGLLEAFVELMAALMSNPVGWVIIAVAIILMAIAG